MSHTDPSGTQVLRLKDGRQIRCQVLGFLERDFLVRVPHPGRKGIDRQRIPFGLVDYVDDELPRKEE